MKTLTEIKEKMIELVEEYKTSNGFGQAAIGQQLSLLCWVVGTNYNEFSKSNLEQFDKSRGPIGTKYK